MKARVKHTGEWITVNPCNDGFYDVNTHDIYEPDELDFTPGFDWSAFRREAAKDFICAMLQDTRISYSQAYEWFCQQALDLADELIKQLKER